MTPTTNLANVMLSSVYNMSGRVVSDLQHERPCCISFTTAAAVLYHIYNHQSLAFGS